MQGRVGFRSMRGLLPVLALVRGRPTVESGLPLACRTCPDALHASHTGPRNGGLQRWPRTVTGARRQTASPGERRTGRTGGPAVESSSCDVLRVVSLLVASVDGDKESHLRGQDRPTTVP